MKKWLCILLAGIMVLSLTACKKPVSSNLETTDNESTEQVATDEQYIQLSGFGDAGTQVTKFANKTAFTEPIIIQDSQGPIVINPPQFTGIPVSATYETFYRFADDLAMVKVKLDAGDRYVYINKEGRVVKSTSEQPTKDKLQIVDPSSIGAAYYAGEGMYAYTEYTTAEGVEWSYLYGIMDKEGNKITEPKYWGIPAITFYDGYALVSKPDGTSVMLDTLCNEYGSHVGGRSNGYGTAVAATRDSSGTFAEYLYDRDGEQISAPYDCIGYLYEGLALVEKNGFVGIMDYNGNERLAPTIAFDALTYWGNENSGYSPIFLDEDAFILPIGGELAVINIDRKTGETILNQATLAYEAFLKGEQSVSVEDGTELYVKNFGDTGKGINAYALSDVSGDGIPELFLRSQHTSILSYTDQGIVHWYTSGSWQPLYVLENGAVLDIHSSIGTYYTYITFDSAGTKTTVNFYSSPSGHHFEEKDVSMDQWDELTQPYLSLAQTELQWYEWYAYQPTHIADTYYPVLNNKQAFYLQGRGELLLKDYVFPESGTLIQNTHDVKIAQYKRDDGKRVVAIQCTFATLVLIEDGGKVYGKSYTFRNLDDLRSDGSFNWNDTDAEGLHYGTKRLAFQDGKITEVELCRVDDDQKGNIKYTLYGKEVTKQQYDIQVYAGFGSPLSWQPMGEYPNGPFW